MMPIATRRGYYLNSQMEKRALLAQPPEVTTSIEENKLSGRPLISEIQKISRRVKQAVHRVPHQEVRNHCSIGFMFGTRASFVPQISYALSSRSLFEKNH